MSNAPDYDFPLDMLRFGCFRALELSAIEKRE
jgi:hypothetical protein